MRTLTLTAVVLTLALGLAGCADKKPAKINIDTSPVVTNASYFTLPAAAVNAKGETIEGVTLAWSGGPADVLEVSADGNLRCAKTGDATLLVLKVGDWTAPRSETRSAAVVPPLIVCGPSPAATV